MLGLPRPSPTLGLHQKLFSRHADISIASALAVMSSIQMERVVDGIRMIEIMQRCYPGLILASSAKVFAPNQEPPANQSSRIPQILPAYIQLVGNGRGNPRRMLGSCSYSHTIHEVLGLPRSISTTVEVRAWALRIPRLTAYRTGAHSRPERSL